MNAYDPLALFKAHRTREERAERNASGKGGGVFSAVSSRVRRNFREKFASRGKYQTRFI